MGEKIARPFASKPVRMENVLVGQMLADYGEIEFELFTILCLASEDARDRLKTVFRLRRRRERLEVMDALIRPKFVEIGLEAKFAQAMDAVDYCRNLFSQYDTCHWFRRDGGLYFLDLEEPNDGEFDAGKMRVLATDADLLASQKAYFDYARLCLVHLRGVLARKRGASDRAARTMPPKRIRPKMYIRAASERVSAVGASDDRRASRTHVRPAAQ